MQLQEQVCDLERAKKLKELGVKQDSYFYWSQKGIEPWHIFSDEYLKIEKDSGAVSVFTVAELGELLPIGYRSFKRWAKENGEDVIVWRCESPVEHLIDQWSVEADTEANVRAKYLIKLIELKSYTQNVQTNS